MVISYFLIQKPILKFRVRSKNKLARETPLLVSSYSAWLAIVGASAMPQMHQPDPSPVRPPLCPDCQGLMRPAAAEPDSRNANLRHVLFVCNCGRASDQLIAKTE